MTSDQAEQLLALLSSIAESLRILVNMAETAVSNDEEF
jgi:hypothetical protein